VLLLLLLLLLLHVTTVAACYCALLLLLPPTRTLAGYAQDIHAFIFYALWAALVLMYWEV
jgi:hypothetical protein